MTLAESWRLYGDLLEKKADEIVKKDSLLLVGSDVSRAMAVTLYAAAELAEEVALSCERDCP